MTDLHQISLALKTVIDGGYNASEEAMDGYDQAANHAQQLAWIQEAERLVYESTQRLLTVDEARLLAWAGNLQFKPQEKQSEQIKSYR